MPMPKEPPDLDVVARTIKALSSELALERRRREVAERSWRRAEVEVERLTAWIAARLPPPSVI